jgi:hypothetical protein
VLSVCVTTRSPRAYGSAITDPGVAAAIETTLQTVDCCDGGVGALLYVLVDRSDRSHVATQRLRRGFEFRDPILCRLEFFLQCFDPSGEVASRRERLEISIVAADRPFDRAESPVQPFSIWHGRRWSCHPT